MKIFLIIIGIYFLIRWTIKPLMRIVLQKAVNDFAEKNGGTYRKEYRYESGRSSKPEGSVKVDYIPPSAGGRKPASDDGEYVDYVEVK